HTKGFRALIAVALAVVLLGNGAIDRISYLFATDEGAHEAHEEVTIPAPQPTPGPTSPPAVREEDEGLGDGDEGLEETDEPEPQSQPTPDVLHPALEQGLGDRGQGLEEKDAPESPSDSQAEDEPEDEDEAAEESAAPGNPIAEAIAADGMAYVRVHGDVFSSTNLRARDRLGRVSGMAIATQYNEASENQPATVRVVFESDGALVEGYMNASSVVLLGYEEAIAEIGTRALFAYKSAAWPLAPVSFDPVEAVESESGESESADVPEIEPVITLSASIDGGKAVITALIEGVPEGVFYTLQWQNDLSGEFEDVPGETGESVVFDITEENLRCRWRVALKIVDAGA
ncbi:MAG: hypothetical protein FWD25_12710, partial [Clostridia bacterium]|nr:hypothetical protein [Clostridia bacterium]